MIVVELFSKDDCRLCDRVKETLLRVQERHPFELRETKITRLRAMFLHDQELAPFLDHLIEDLNREATA